MYLPGFGSWTREGEYMDSPLRWDISLLLPIDRAPVNGNENNEEPNVPRGTLEDTPKLNQHE